MLVTKYPTLIPVKTRFLNSNIIIDPTELPIAIVTFCVILCNALILPCSESPTDFIKADTFEGWKKPPTYPINKQCNCNYWCRRFFGSKRI